MKGINKLGGIQFYKIGQFETAFGLKLVLDYLF